MGSNYTVKYDVDVVFCIDATGSMDHILDMVKTNAVNFYQDFQREMNRKHKKSDGLRLRIIAFRDYVYDKQDAMLETDFFSLPEQAYDLEACVKSIEAFGGGDPEEDGLEALTYAMHSDWRRTSSKRRHVIVVWSDDGTHEIGFADKKYPEYPKGMPKDFNELTLRWGSPGHPGIMDQDAKRLVLFTPDYRYWSDITNNWDKVIHFQSEAGKGLKSVDYEQILDVITNSI